MCLRVRCIHYNVGGRRGDDLGNLVGVGEIEDYAIAGWLSACSHSDMAPRARLVHHRRAHEPRTTHNKNFHQTSVDDDFGLADHPSFNQAAMS